MPTSPYRSPQHTEQEQPQEELGRTAQQARESIVQSAIYHATSAESHLRDAVEWVTILQPAQRHQSLLTEIRQFVEEVEKLS